MGEPVGDDYFGNHANKLRFPWSLYHRPIVRAVARAIEDAPGDRVLNVGSGPFLELDQLPPGREYVASDVDARAIEEAVRVHGPRLADAVVTEVGADLPFDDGEMDVVFACDVIEHVLDVAGFLAKLRRVLRPGGSLFLTTPNYGLSTLPLIEATALEWTARRQGFSRRHIHPSKMNRRRLRRALSEADFEGIGVRRISLGWVLFAESTRPR